MKFAALLLLFSFSSFAGVEAYSTPSRQKLFIEEGMNSAKDIFFVKFIGVRGEWSDKVFKVKRSKRSDGQSTYSFDYKLVLSNGSHDRTYQLVTEENKSLVNGSLVKRVKLWTPENARDGVEFIYDADLTKTSQDLKLEEAGKKPFVPEII